MTTQNTAIEKNCQHKRKCLYCQKEFTHGRSDKKFCSSTCKAKNWDKNHTPLRAIVMVVTAPTIKQGFIKRVFNLIW